MQDAPVSAPGRAAAPSAPAAAAAPEAVVRESPASATHPAVPAPAHTLSVGAEQRANAVIVDQNPWVVPVTLDERTEHVQAHIDCAAAVSLISQMTVAPLELLRKVYVEKEEAVQLVDAQGRGMKHLGRVRLDIGIGGKKYPFVLLVVPNLAAPMLLGRDFLNRHGKHIDIAAGTVEFDDGPTVPMRNPELFEIPVCHVKGVVTVPKGTKAEIAVVAGGNKPLPRDVLLSPHAALHICRPHLKWNPVFVQGRADREYIITCENTGPTDVTLQKGFPLAEAEEVTVDREGLRRLSQRVRVAVEFEGEPVRHKDRVSKKSTSGATRVESVVIDWQFVPAPEGITTDELSAIRKILQPSPQAAPRKMGSTLTVNGQQIGNAKGQWFVAVPDLSIIVRTKDWRKTVSVIREVFPSGGKLALRVGYVAKTRVVTEPEKAGVNAVGAAQSEKADGQTADGGAGTRQVPWKLSTELSPEGREKLLSVLNEFTDRAPSVFVPGQAKVPPFEIETKEGTKPIKAAARRIPHALLEEVLDSLRRGLADGTYQRSTSEWASPLLAVRKKDGTLRLCVDYRQLNERTIPLQGTMPRVDGAWDQLRSKPALLMDRPTDQAPPIGLTDQAPHPVILSNREKKKFIISSPFAPSAAA